MSEHINILDYTKETSYVLSNKYNKFGAACMLYKDTLKTFANSIESDLVIVPANIDVLYIFDGKSNYNYYEKILKQSNYCNKTERILSKNIIQYDRKKNKLNIESYLDFMRR